MIREFDDAKIEESSFSSLIGFARSHRPRWDTHMRVTISKTHNSYNLGRNIKTTYADGRVEEKKYDQSDNVVESWNNQGDKRKSYRVIANIDALGNRTTIIPQEKQTIF